LFTPHKSVKLAMVWCGSLTSREPCFCTSQLLDLLSGLEKIHTDKEKAKRLAWLFL
jgi:hypothetical protein